MKITLLAAIDDARGIAKEGAIPWDLPEDRKRFKARTLGKVVLWGRATHDTLGGRKLVDREVLVLSRNPDYHPPNPHEHRVDSWKQALLAAEAFWASHGTDGDSRELIVAGGQDVYALALPYAHRVELTEVNGFFGCDRFFPALERKEWRLEGMSQHWHQQGAFTATGRYVAYTRVAGPEGA